MLLKINGGSSGAIEYLKTGTMVNRQGYRDEIDNRVVLSNEFEEASEDLFNKIIDSVDYNSKYYHFTLSFKKKNVTHELVQNLNEEFKNFVFTGFDEDEYHYHAEVHYPKKDKYDNPKFGDENRKAHIHFLVPKLNLLTGNQLKVSEDMRSDIQYFDAFQEYINLKYDLDSPKENLRSVKKHSKYDYISRYKQDYDKIEDIPQKKIKKAIYDEIYNMVKDNRLNSIDEVMDHLKNKNYIVDEYTRTRRNKEYNYNGVRYVNSKNQDYLTVRVKNFDKNIRLKGKIFTKDYYKDIDKKRNDLERKIEGKGIDEYKKLLEEWKDKRKQQVEKRYNKSRKKSYNKYLNLIKEVTDEFEKDRVVVTSKDVYNIAKLDNIYNQGIDKIDIKSALVDKDEFYFYKDTETNSVVFANTDKNILIKDQGDKIDFRSKYYEKDTDIKTAVSSVLDLAEAKGWGLDQLNINGGKEFRKEALKQIKERTSSKSKKRSNKINMGKLRDQELYEGYSNFANHNLEKKKIGASFKFRDNQIDIEYNREHIEKTVELLLNELESKDWDLDKISIPEDKQLSEEIERQINKRKNKKKKRKIKRRKSNNDNKLKDARSHYRTNEYKNKKKNDRHYLKDKINMINKNLDPNTAIDVLNIERDNIKSIFYGDKVDRYLIRNNKDNYYSLVNYIKAKTNRDLKDVVNILDNIRREESMDKRYNNLKDINKDDMLKAEDLLRAFDVSKSDYNSTFYGDKAEKWIVKDSDNNFKTLTNFLIEKGKDRENIIEKLNNNHKKFIMQSKINNINEAIEEAKQINLVDYLKEQGYEIDKSKSTSSNKILKNGEDVLSVSKKNGHYVYYNFKDNSDYGSIIDFVKNRTSTEDMEEILKEINRDTRILDVKISSKQKEKVKEDKISRKEKIEKAKKLWNKARRSFANDYRYLIENRGINRGIVNKYKGKYIEQDGKGNIVFKLQSYEDNKLDTVGVSKYNDDFKQIQGSKSIFVGNENKYNEKIIITESPIDALSHHQLKNGYKNTYISTEGRLSKEGLETISKYIENRSIKKIELSLDNDETGRKMMNEIEDKLKGMGLDIERKTSKEKDWNEELYKSRKGKHRSR